MFQKDVPIVENVESKPHNFLMTFQDAEIAAKSRVGQFLQFKAGGLENMLRIPISIARVVGDRVSILYHVVGNGTDVMSKLRVGDSINVLGPLGNGFPQDISADKEILFVAGGIGFGPFPYAMDRCSNWKLFYGVRNEAQLLLQDEIAALEEAGKAFVATDDGSYGTQGFVTDLLDAYLAKDSRNKVIFCCGPNPMMKRVCEVAAKHGVESHISMEDYMGCGIGICVGCVRKIRDASKPDGWEHKKVCKDGPVFKGEDILWN